MSPQNRNADRSWQSPLHEEFCQTIAELNGRAVPVCQPAEIDLSRWQLPDLEVVGGIEQAVEPVIRHVPILSNHVAEPTKEILDHEHYHDILPEIRQMLLKLLEEQSVEVRGEQSVEVRDTTAALVG